MREIFGSSEDEESQISAPNGSTTSVPKSMMSTENKETQTNNCNISVCSFCGKLYSKINPFMKPRQSERIKKLTPIKYFNIKRKCKVPKCMT